MSKLRFRSLSGRGKAAEISLDEAAAKLAKGGWLDIKNPSEAEKDFLLTCGFHELAVEDCFTEPITRFYVYDNHKFVVLLARDKDRSDLGTEYLSVFVRDNHIVTVRHSEMPAIDEFERRLRTDRSQNRSALGAEYLLYELLDEVADDWYNVLERFNERLETIEDNVLDPHTRYPDLLERMHEIKQDLREIHKSSQPLNRIIARMLRRDSDFVPEELKVFYQDLADQAKGIDERVNNLSTGTSSVRDTYISQSSLVFAESNQRLTEVISTITLIGAIILPLTLITSVFGMNLGAFGAGGGVYDLKHVLAVMAGFTVIAGIWFRKKGWL